ncbi:MAG: peptidylprolyl isomerase [Kofleriaceae bacterium]
MKPSQPPIVDGSIVRLHYSLSIDGTLIDRTDVAPIEVIHGRHQLVPGLEAALAGRRAGEEFEVRVAAGDGYGDVAPGGLQPIPRAVFPLEMDLYPGLVFLGEGRHGDHLPLWIARVEGDEVLVSANHPYAGRSLDFRVSIVDVVEARVIES